MAANIYELLGRKVAELNDLNAEYDRLLAVIADMAAGTISPARVTVDLAGRSWAVAPFEPEPLSPGCLPPPDSPAEG